MEVETEREERAEWTVFNWTSFSYLLTTLTQFITWRCSTTWLDMHEIVVVDRPDCKPEHRGTVQEKQIVWTWRADDLKKRSDQRRRRVWRVFPPRDHELRLRRFFGEFDLDVDQHWAAWIVRLSFPETLDHPTHTFHEKRDSPPSARDWSSCHLSDDSDDDDDDDDDNDDDDDDEEEEEEEEKEDEKDRGAPS
jgi:hypothetical protein